MDSEPVAWPAGSRRRRHALPAEDAPANVGEEGSAAEREAVDAPAVEETAAFSREAASPRRDAFAKRLSDELARPPERKAPPAAEAGAAKSAEAGAEKGAEAEVATPRSRATPTLTRSADAVPARPGDGSRRQPAPADTEPQDALDWELDNAIGAIIASGRSGEAESEAPPAAAPAIPTDAAPVPVIPSESPRTAAAPAQPPAPATRPAAIVPATAREALPVGPVGGVRRKPVPTFRFDRREEPDDTVPAVPRDVDDPLANVFFDDVRDAFDAVHPGSPGGDMAETLSELEADSYDPPRDDDDELPPSLVRAAAPVRQRRRPWRASGIAATVVGIAAVAVAAVIGMNVFAGPGSSGGEPPIIRADARDVKVEATADPDAGEVRPDITERTALGDSDRLVLPDDVTIADAALPDEAPGEDELVSRRVRTVVVRPDGTIVPAEPSDDAAAAAFEDTQAPPAGRFAAADGLDDGAVADVAAVDVGESDPELGGEAGVPIEVARSELASQDVEPFDPAADEASTEFGEGAADPLAAEGAAAAVPRPRPPVPPTAGRATARIAAAPATQPLALQSNASPSTATEPPVTPWDAPATTSAGANAPWAVQLASQRTRADAETSLRNLQQRYPNLVGSAEPMIVAANVDGRGTFYRVRLPAASRGEAAALCDRLKAAGADCFIGRN